MPIIEVKAFDHRFEDPQRAEELIEKLTRALGEVFGEQAQSETEVLLLGVPRSCWGFGGATRK
jgi:phenylpyruvate tautomerase PptA (4-oxalocrotonate tautomerase family)